MRAHNSMWRIYVRGLGERKLQGEKFEENQRKRFSHFFAYEKILVSSLTAMIERAVAITGRRMLITKSFAMPVKKL